MKHTILILISLLFVLNVSKAQNVDSFTVSNSKPYNCKYVDLISLSTNVTSLKWVITGGYYTFGGGSIYDSVFNIMLNSVGCFNISLIIKRGSTYDTVSKQCALQVTDPIYIVLKGKKIDTVDVYTMYVDSGFVAQSNCSGIKKHYAAGSVNTSIVGKYVRKYYAENNVGDIDSTERIIYVVDRVSPIIYLNGYGLMQMEIFCKFNDPKYSVIDNYWNSSEIKIHTSGSVDSSKLGFDTLYYWAEDGSGNLSVKLMRVVQVVNLRPPYFEKTSIEIPVFSKYTDGFKINHYCCELKDIEVFSIGKVDTAKIGTYTIKAWLKDCRGFVSDTAVQVVKVVDKTPPVIKLLSKYNNNSIYVNDTIHFNPIDSIKVTDNYDPNPKIYLTGTYYSDYLKNFKKGFYTIVFNAEDQSGNKAIPVNFYEYVHINSIPEFSDNVFRIFPNPGNGQFTLEIKNPERVNFIRIIDMTGKQILAITALQQSNEITLPDFCHGIYLLQLVNKEGVFSEKIYIK